MTNMSKTTETDTSKEDVKTTETEEETGAEEVPETPEEEEEVETDKKVTDTKIDYDAEIDAENKRGKPDLKIASEAFQDRKKKRTGSDEAVEDDDAEVEDRPLTMKDVAMIEARTERKLLAGQALTFAKGLAENDKEAELVVARWNNRTFPQGITLSEQIEEIYTGLPHVRKRLIGERNEALRALKGKNGARKDAATTHRPSPAGSAPQVTSAESHAFTAAGFSLNSQTRQWEKKLSNGDILIRDKSGKTRLVKGKKKS